MRPTRRELLAGAVWAPFALGAAARAQVRDTGGHAVPVPARVGRVFAAGPPAAVLVYVLAPETLLGWTSAPTADERPFLAAPYRDLPVLGRLAGRGSTVPLEWLVELKPDLILDVGAVNPTYTSTAERVERQTGIPCVLLGGRIGDSARLLREAGAILRVPDRAERLARAAEAILAEVARVRAEVASPARVYFARGADGLETGLEGSINTEIVEFVGAKNVAAAAGRGGLTHVSLEQILDWNPDTIVTQDAAFARRAASDPLWRGVAAVEAGRILLAPAVPFGWLDAPPGVNRLIGARWLLARLHPDRVRIDLDAEVARFFDLFYQVRLSRGDLDRLLGGAR